MEKEARGGPEEQAASKRIDEYLEKVCTPAMREADVGENKKRRRNEPEAEVKKSEGGEPQTGRETTHSAGEPGHGEARGSGDSGGEVPRRRRRPRDDGGEMPAEPMRRRARREEVAQEDSEGDVEIDEVEDEWAEEQ